MKQYVEESADEAVEGNEEPPMKKPRRRAPKAKGKKDKKEDKKSKKAKKENKFADIGFSTYSDRLRSACLLETFARELVEGRYGR